FIRIHKIRKDDGGQAAVFAALILLVLVMFVMLVVDVGQLVTWRIRMQNATDSAAMAGAVWQARGLNVIAVLNIIWVPVFIFELVQCFMAAAGSFGAALLVYPFKLTNIVQDIQDVMSYAIPAVAISQVVTYGRANKADIAVPLPIAGVEKLLSINSISDVEGIYAGGKDLYEKIKSEGVGAFKSSIPCWLDVERQTYFYNPVAGKLGFMTGGSNAYTFSLAYKSPQPVLFGGSLLGIKRTPSIYTVAKAAPYGGSLGGVEFAEPAANLGGEGKHKKKTVKTKDGKTKETTEKDKEGTKKVLTTKIGFNIRPDPDYKAKFVKTEGFDRILMVH
ncbi:Tad domain-containing protein, partial [bacterium]|nr:Tad domain-containing protein [bacterium]